MLVTEICQLSNRLFMQDKLTCNVFVNRVDGIHDEGLRHTTLDKFGATLVAHCRTHGYIEPCNTAPHWPRTHRGSEGAVCYWLIRRLMRSYWWMHAR